MKGPGKPLGLRATVSLAAVALSALSILVAGTLIVLTTRLHDTSATLRETVRDVRYGRRVEVDLLLRDATSDPAESALLDESLDSSARRLTERTEGSPATRAARARVASEVGRYLVMHSAETLASARQSIDDMVQSVVADAERASAGADRLDRLGDEIGAGSAALILAVPALLLWWMRDSVARPMLELSTAMKRFREGDMAVRAPVEGATELGRMSAQFNSMAVALQRQHEARLAHLAGVAHDLRNPLAALRLSVGLVDATRAQLDAATARAFRVVRRQVERLTRMVEDLLDATRIEAGELALVRTPTDLRSVVRASVELFENTSPIHTFHVELQETPLLAECDAHRIEQTLNNLLSNAIKYSPRGGLIDVVARQVGNRATVAVTDQGLGIAPDDLAGIFEPFQRRGISAEEVSGVGLGLWVSKRIVEAHGGDIAVSSTVHGGSTFTVSLPLAATPTTAPLPVLPRFVVPEGGPPATGHG